MSRFTNISPPKQLDKDFLKSALFISKQDDKDDPSSKENNHHSTNLEEKYVEQLEKLDSLQHKKQTLSKKRKATDEDENEENWDDETNGLEIPNTIDRVVSIDTDSKKIGGRDLFTLTPRKIVKSIQPAENTFTPPRKLPRLSIMSTPRSAINHVSKSKQSQQIFFKEPPATTPSRKLKPLDKDLARSVYTPSKTNTPTRRGSSKLNATSAEKQTAHNKKLQNYHATPTKPKVTKNILYNATPVVDQRLRRSQRHMKMIHKQEQVDSSSSSSSDEDEASDFDQDSDTHNSEEALSDADDDDEEEDDEDGSNSSASLTRLVDSKRNYSDEPVAGGDNEVSADEVQEKRHRSRRKVSEAGRKYFENLHGASSKTSNHTLAKLVNKDTLGATSKYTARFVKEQNELLQTHHRRFNQWLFELENGFNLIFYGYGSKRSLLHTFVTKQVKNGPTVIVNGYSPAVTIKDILVEIENLIKSFSAKLYKTFEADISGSSTQDLYRKITMYMDHPSRVIPVLYVLIHDIDGSGLRADITQRFLSALASSANIQLIASVDHLNAPFLWDSVRANQFNWIWHDATTFAPYTVEVSYENSWWQEVNATSDKMATKRSAIYVLRSLTSNSRGIFKILANYQLEQMEAQAERSDHSPESDAENAPKVKKNGSDGQTRKNADYALSYKAFMNKCRDEFLVTNANAFQTQLTEFLDHGIIRKTKMDKSGNNSQSFYIDIGKTKFEELLEEMDS